MENIPGYHILEKIGEGGMATVYKGLQLSLKRLVAIKVLQKKLADHPSVMERFKRESLIIARLNNPHIIHIIDRGITQEGMPYFIMEYVEGKDLDMAAKSGDLNLNRKLEIIVQICKALSYAHKNGVIHRDIKPSNVLIDKDEHVKVLDFGIAQFYDDEDPEMNHTRTETVMGTPDFMSPEQRTTSSGVTSLSDLYSLGVVMYELFTGMRPIGRYSLPAEIDPSVPETVQDIIMTCLETDPADRPNSADEIIEKLLKVLDGAHLKTEQKNRADQNIFDVKEKFALLDVIKEAPQGSVYLYEDQNNKHLMVIKKKPGKSTGYLEAKLLSSLRHDHIADILGTSKNRNVFIVVMEYLSGGSLKDRMLQPYAINTFFVLAKQICQGLSFAHRNGIIHGNLRPSNILFSQTGVIKITDFGLDEHYIPPKGKVNWYNPAGENRSIPGDILAAGVVFLQMLTGRDPEWVDDALSLNEDFDALPIELQAILIKMFSTKKKNRYKSINEVMSDLNAFMTENKQDARTIDTTLLEERPHHPILPPAKPAESPSFRPLILLLLLMLLLFTALFYLTYTGDIHYYINLARDLFNSFTVKLSL